MEMTIAAPDDARPYADLGKRIAAARRAQRWTQRELARYADISEGYLPRIETGRNRPDREKLRTLARVLGLDYDELLILAGYADSRLRLDTMPVRPGYRGVLARLQEVFTPTQLSSLERLYQELFTETVTVRRRADEVPQDAGHDQRGERAPEEDADDTDLCG